MTTSLMASSHSKPKIAFTFLGKSGLKVSNICLGTVTFGKRNDSQVRFDLTFSKQMFIYVFLSCPVTIWPFPTYNGSAAVDFENIQAKI